MPDGLEGATMKRREQQMSLFEEARADEERVTRFLAHRESGMSDWDARELSRYKNDPYPEKCPECGASSDEFQEGSGMVGETVVWCGQCHTLLWEDTVGAVRRVL